MTDTALSALVRGMGHDNDRHVAARRGARSREDWDSAIYLQGLQESP